MPRWLRVDPFALALLITVGLGSFLPCRGEVARGFDLVTVAAIALLFFLHGAKLSRQAIMAGAMHWRLHLLIFASTFILFPVLGFLAKPLGSSLIPPELYLGVLFLCALPSTVQSSIAFTSIAGGNIPAAICSASASNLFGVVLTPLLVGLLMKTQGGHGAMLDSVMGIVTQILLPFVAGQIARTWIGGWVTRHKILTRCVDQGSILLVVYTAFSEAVIEGLWRQIPLAALGWLVVINAALLAIVLTLLWFGSGALGFNRADRITITFCGSKKSLASGVPIAKVLFASHLVGPMVLPLMLFHQIQIMVCAALAQKWAKEHSAEKSV